MEECPVIELTKEEINEYNNLLHWALSLSHERIDFLFDGGWYNDTIKGYLIAALRESRFSDDDIRDLLRSMRSVLEEYDKQQADNIFRSFK